jgi:spore coat polysaccharide biosynthesis predicted glycosyltransferase SpsG
LINKDIANYIDRIDLSIISGGSLVFECIYNGIPVYVMNISDNQIKISKKWKEIQNY